MICCGLDEIKLLLLNTNDTTVFVLCSNSYFQGVATHLQNLAVEEIKVSRGNCGFPVLFYCRCNSHKIKTRVLFSDVQEMDSNLIVPQYSLVESGVHVGLSVVLLSVVFHKISNLGWNRDTKTGHHVYKGIA